MIPSALIGVFASLIAATNPTLAPATDELVIKMLAKDAERQGALLGYTVTRRYILENKSHRKRAEMLVRMNCYEDGSKRFEIIDESGWGGALRHVFPRLLQAEIEAAYPHARELSRITSENYKFEMLGTESLRGRRVYVLSIEPKTTNKYLVRGRIWVDDEEYAIMRVEGVPAKNPSFWIKSTHFVHDYDKTGVFWFPVKNQSVTDARLFGTTEVTIEYFDYRPKDVIELAP